MFGVSPMPLIWYGPTPLSESRSTVFSGGMSRDRRDLVVAEGERGHAPVLDAQLLHQRVADALDEAAVDLPLVADRVDDLADVVGGGEVEQLDLARLRVDRDLGDLDGEAGDLACGPAR